MEIHRRTAIVLSCSPFALIGLVALWYGWVNFKATREANALLARLEERGHPTVVEDLYPPVENPDDAMMQHPAMIAELAMPDGEKLDRINRDTYGSRITGMSERGTGSAKPHMGVFRDVRDYFDPVRHEIQQEAAAEMLAALAPELARVDALLQAFARPVAGWTIRREAGGQNELDEIHWEGQFEVYRLAIFIGEAALLHLASGNPDAAVRLMDGLFDVHRHFVSPPHFLIKSLISSVLYRELAGLIQHGVAHGVWEDRHLVAFGERIRLLAPESAFVAAMSGEFTLCADYLRQMLAGKSEMNMGGFDPGDLDLNDLDGIGDHLREFWRAARPRGLAMLDMVDAIEWLHRDGVFFEGAPRTVFHVHEIEQFSLGEGLVDNVDDLIHSLSAMVLKNGSMRYFDLKITHTLLRTGIALERHRLAHGGHPEALAALAPEFLTEVPQDPCDGQPLRYRLQSDGSPVVWSIGIDGVDEGGKPHRNRESGDRVWVTKPLEGFDERELSR